MLAGVSGDRIGQWARHGYIDASQSRGDPYVYSYQDVAEALVVHELEDAGADLASIRRAIEHLRRRHGSSWPLQHRAGRLGALHGTVVEYDEDIAIEIGGKGSPMQEVLPDHNLRRIAAELERGGWAVRRLPDLHHVEVDPDRLSGRPVIRGTRVPVSMVAELASHPQGMTLLHADFALRDEQIGDARRWWVAATRFQDEADA
jgi:uncharacterized protein (DUF433 family)/DNA-binding transcriptional MerR regulator